MADALAPSFAYHNGDIVGILSAVQKRHMSKFCCSIKSGESEEIKIPRAPPRLSADRLADHIAKSLNL